MAFSRQEYWSGLPFPYPGDLPDAETDPGSPALQAYFFFFKPSELPGKPKTKRSQEKLLGDLPGTPMPLMPFASDFSLSLWNFPDGSVVKNPPTNPGDMG